MTALRLTDHARRRMQQRGLRESELERVLEVGTERQQKGGATLVYVDAAGRRWLRPGEERLASVYLVISDAAGWIVTVGHRTRSLRAH